MINKKVLNGLRIVFLIIFLSYMPLDFARAEVKINENETLGGLKQILKELQNKQAIQNNKKKQTKQQIETNKKNILNAEREMMEAKEQVEEAERSIEKTSEEIAKLKSQIEELMIYYQKLLNENVYISYITGASSVTDLIMRVEANNQFTNSNKKKLDEMETLIKNNQKMEKELVKYQDKLDKKIDAYEASNENLTEELSELEEGAVTIQDEIQNMQALIKKYENMGCKDAQKLTECVKISNNDGWLKPVTKGRITSLYGYRTAPTKGASSYHKGIDIGVQEGTSVYPTADGEVSAIVYPTTSATRCGGKKLYIVTLVNGKKYTYVYMHLMQINVKVGDLVTTNQVVALSGGGPKANQTNQLSDTCTTGPHLHYGLAYGGWYGKDSALSSFNSHTMNPPGYPGLYQWFYSR